MTTFLSISRELRDLIYTHYFSLKYDSPTTFDYCRAGCDKDSVFDSSLHHVSKAIKEEASEFLYSTSYFNINSEYGVWTPGEEQIRMIKHFGASLEMRHLRSINPLDYEPGYTEIIPPEWNEVLSVLAEGAQPSKSCNLNFKLSQRWREDFDNIWLGRMMWALYGYRTVMIDLEWDQSVLWEEEPEWKRDYEYQAYYEPPIFTTVLANFGGACEDALGPGVEYESWGVYGLEFHPASYI